MRAADADFAALPIRNLSPQPIGSAGIPWGFYEAQMVTHDGTVVAPFGPVSQFRRATVMTAAASPILLGYNSMPVTFGSVYSCSIHARCAGFAPNGGTAQWFTAGGSSPSSQSPTRIVNLGADLYRFDWRALTPPAGIATVRIWASYPKEAGAVGKLLDVSALMFTATPTLRAYRDGSFPGWRWLGGANASQSLGIAPPI